MTPTLILIEVVYRLTWFAQYHDLDLWYLLLHQFEPGSTEDETLARLSNALAVQSARDCVPVRLSIPMLDASRVTHQMRLVAQGIHATEARHALELALSDFRRNTATT